MANHDLVRGSLLQDRKPSWLQESNREEPDNTLEQVIDRTLAKLDEVFENAGRLDSKVELKPPH